MNKQQIAFINRAFDPTCFITINSSNEIIDRSNNEQLHSMNLVTFIEESNNLIDDDLYTMLYKNLKNTPVFINSLQLCVTHQEPLIMALSNDIKITNRLAVPCIYLFLVTIHKNIQDSTTSIKFYNLIEVSRNMQSLFVASIAPSALSIAQRIRLKLKKKSLYFAYESLKCMAGFVKEDQVHHSNGYYLVDLVKNFHATASQTDDKIYKQRLCKYLENNKNQYLYELSQDMIKSIINMPVIPFNQLSENVLITI